MTTKVVRLLEQGTEVVAQDDFGRAIPGVVEAYRFVQNNGSVPAEYKIEYKVRWSDGLRDWYPWEELDGFNPQRPRRVDGRGGWYRGKRAFKSPVSKGR